MNEIKKYLDFVEKEENVVLDLSNKGLRKIPERVLSFSWLKSLHLNDNSIRIIPDEIENLPNLKFIALGNNNLTSLPKTIHKLNKLERLYLSNNKIQNLPKQIGSLNKLKVLILSDNELKELPQEIGNLENLEFLHLTNNKLSLLPNEMLNLKKLKSNNSLYAKKGFQIWQNLILIPDAVRYEEPIEIIKAIIHEQQHKMIPESEKSKYPIEYIKLENETIRIEIEEQEKNIRDIVYKIGILKQHIILATNPSERFKTEKEIEYLKKMKKELEKERARLIIK